MAPIQPRDRITPAAAVDPGDESHDWLQAHEALSRLAKQRAHAEWEEGRALLAALRAGAHRRLGFGSFFEYVEALFAYKPRSIDEKLRVARALESLPSLAVDRGVPVVLPARSRLRPFRVAVRVQILREQIGRAHV